MLPILLKLVQVLVCELLQPISRSISKREIACVNLLDATVVAHKLLVLSRLNGLETLVLLSAHEPVIKQTHWVLTNRILVHSLIRRGVPFHSVH